MNFFLFVLAAAAFVATANASACCVYTNSTGQCDEEMCPNTCVWTYTECPYYADCTLMQRYTSPACTEAGGCVCNPSNFLGGSKKLVKTSHMGVIRVADSDIYYDKNGPINQ